MKWAICNETYQDWPLEQACAHAQRCGYTGLEIAPFTLFSEIRQFSAAQRATTRQVIEAAGLEVVGLHWLLAKTRGLYLTHPDAEVRRRTADYLGELARLCQDLGGSLLVFGSPQQRNLLPGVSGAQGLQFAAEVFSELAHTLERLEITLAVEPLGPAEGDFLNTAAETVQLIERVGSPWVRLHLDCKAMSSEAHSIPDLLRTHRRLLAHFHANDPNRQGPGMGQLDFHPILAALAEIDYRGWVSVEVFDYSPGIERLAEGSLEYLEACLANLHEPEAE